LPTLPRFVKVGATQNKTAKLIAVIERDALKGLIDNDTVSRIFAGINDDVEPIIGLTGSTIDNKVFYIPSNATWQIIKTENGFYTMTKNGATGITPIDPTIDPKWLCSTCKNYGPWDGNLCLMCGKASYD